MICVLHNLYRLTDWDNGTGWTRKKFKMVSRSAYERLNVCVCLCERARAPRSCACVRARVFACCEYPSIFYVFDSPTTQRVVYTAVSAVEGCVPIPEPGVISQCSSKLEWQSAPSPRENLKPEPRTLALFLFHFTTLSPRVHRTARRRRRVV